MSVATNPIDVRDYLRVVFSRAWWFMFVTLGVVALVTYASFFMSKRVYQASNEIAITDKYSGSLSKDIGRNPDWVTRTLKAELEFKRPVPARETIADAAAAVGIRLSDKKLASMVGSFKKDMKVNHLKKADFIELSYQADDALLAASVMSLFIKRMIEYCVTMQVEKLNTEVRTLSSMRGRLAAEVASAERRLDRMRTVPPELRLAATTRYLLQSGRELSTMPSTEQVVHVFVELQKDIMGLDSRIADTAKRIETIEKQIAFEPKAVPAQRRLEQLPAVREALKRRDGLQLQLAELLSNSTARHPLVREIQAQLKSLDALLEASATHATVEIVYEANARRQELKKEMATLERDLEGIKERRVAMEENARQWRDKLDRMPSELRIVREAMDEYEKKRQSLSMIVDRLVRAQIKRRFEMNQVGTYYRPQYDLTPVPSTYRKPSHPKHIALGLVLGIVASIFVVYAMEFADHSVKDMHDLKLHSKAAVLGVLSDYNQLKAVVQRTVRVKASVANKYILATIFLAFLSLVVWTAWKNWPRPNGHENLPASLSMTTVVNIEQAMSLYTDETADLTEYMSDPETDIDVTPAVIAPDDDPRPILSQ